jgi:hypothetical protein
MTASADSSLTFGKGKIVLRGTADVFLWDETTQSGDGGIYPTWP